MTNRSPSGWGSGPPSPPWQPPAAPPSAWKAQPSPQWQPPRPPKRPWLRPGWPALVFTVAIFIVSGIALAITKDDDSHTTSSFSDGVATPIPINEVPLPVGAVKDEKLSSAGTLAYRIPGMSYDSLLGFYAAQMPARSAWHGLPWCDSSEFKTDPKSSVLTTQRSWRAAGTNDYLVMHLIGPEPPYAAAVLIDDDQDDPAGCD